MPFRKWIKPLAALLVAAWIAMWLIGRWRPAPAAHEPSMPATPVAMTRPASASLYLGTARCAAGPCHGGMRDNDRPTWRSSFTVWLNDDPHAKAYSDLLAPRGQEIAARYFADEPTARGEQEQRCLSCHLTRDTPHDTAGASLEGVGCESCHGPSRDWLDKHWLPSWKPARNAPGFRDLRNLNERARSCVPCHVGAAGQEVNHDLIAAGHPALRFELSAYHEQMPKHWDASMDMTLNFGGEESRLWLRGQLESSRAALDLLRHRVMKQNNPWPEFAEYDCESCHHPLANASWRAASKGHPIWGTWYFSPAMVSMAHVLVKHPAQPTEEQLNALRDAMSTLSSNRADIEKLLESLLTSWPDPAIASDSSMRDETQLGATEFLSEPSTTTADLTWSAAAQRWLAAVALRPPRSSREHGFDMHDMQWSELLQARRRQLADPATFDPTVIQWQTSPTKD